MKKSSKILIVTFAILIGVAVFALRDFIIPKTWNYKITIEIETPEGIKSGSAVRQVTGRRELAGYLNPGVPVVMYRVYGEAVLIDLEEQGLLFYPIDWDSNYMFEKSFPTDVKDHWEKIKYFDALPLGTEVTQTGWKSFVWLKKPDGGTEPLQRLDSKDFETALGSGFKLSKAIIAVTDEGVTWNLDPVLSKISGRLGKYRRASLQYKK